MSLLSDFQDAGVEVELSDGFNLEFTIAIGGTVYNITKGIIADLIDEQICDIITDLHVDTEAIRAERQVDEWLERRACGE